MRQLFITLIFTLILTPFAAAQNQEDEAKKLSGKITAAYQKGDWETAVSNGEKLVKLERNSSDYLSHISALQILAKIEREYYTTLANKLNGGNLSAAEITAAAKKAGKIGDDAEATYREAIALNEKMGETDTQVHADLETDLGWMLIHHTYSGEKTVDKSRERIDEAEKLLLASIALNEQISGKDSGQTLAVALDAGDFYYKYVNFEKALPYYERFIETDTQKNGANHPDLVRALRPYAAILQTTQQDQKAADAIKKIESVTRKPESAPKAELDFQLRSKDAVAYSSTLYSGQGKNSSAPSKLIRVPVKIEVDENGKITNATAQTGNKKLAAEAEAVVSKWIVRPFLYQGTARKMRGVLIYLKAG